MDWTQVLNNILNTVIGWATTAGLRLLIALVLLFVSFKVVNFVARRIEKSGENGKLDKLTRLEGVGNRLYKVFADAVLAYLHNGRLCGCERAEVCSLFRS